MTPKILTLYINKVFAQKIIDQITQSGYKSLPLFYTKEKILKGVC